MSLIRSKRLILALTGAGLIAFIAVGRWNADGELTRTPPTATNIPTPTPGPTPTAYASTINHISLITVGQHLILEGAITNAEDFSAGRRYTLDDGAGTITLLLWQEVVDALPGPDYIATGMRVRVTGVIEEFNAGLEIIPEDVGDVIVLE